MIPQEVAEFIAANVTQNVRELPNWKCSYCECWSNSYSRNWLSFWCS
jgi:hypothetical protein